MVAAFDADGLFELDRSFNVPPTTPVYVIRHDETHRIVDAMSWGLVPFWAKDAKRAANAINARVETLTAGAVASRPLPSYSTTRSISSTR